MSWIKAIWAAKQGKKFAATAKTEAVAQAETYTDAAVLAALDGLSTGSSFKGSVSLPSDLPSNASDGDTYVVIHGNGDANEVTNSRYMRSSGAWINISVANPLTVYSKDENQQYKFTFTVENGHLVSRMSV